MCSSAKAYCAQGIVRAKVQCEQRMIGTRGGARLIIDHVRGVHRVAHCTAQSESHTIVYVNEL